MEPRISLVTLGVDDLARARAFYEAVGWTGAQQPDEVSVVLDAARRAGSTSVREPAVVEWRGTSGAFADPDGYVREVAHNPAWPLRDDGTIAL